MAIETIKVPDLGGADSVEVIELGLSAGDNINVEDTLLVLESDKATMDVPSPVAGSFIKYLVSEGDSVTVGDAIAEIEVAAVAEQSSTASEPVVEEPVSVVEEPVAAAAPAISSASADITATVPDIGSDDQIEVIEISVAVGDVVAEGDTLVVLESDKATMDVPSSHAGTVIEILLKEGDKAGTGSAVAVLKGEGTASAAVESAPSAAASVTPEAAPAPVAAPAPAPVAASGTEVAAVSHTDVYAGPAVRMLARDMGVDLRKVTGTGPRGRIQKDDVNLYVKESLKKLESGATGAVTGTGIPAVPDQDFSKFGEIETVALTKIQKVTAANMQRSWLNVPHVTQFDDADITDLEEFRNTLKAEGEKRGIKVTPVAFIIKAVAAALQANPAFKRSLLADGEHYVQKHYCHVGMAVDTPRGLVVPVIRDADKKGLWEISADIMELAGKARDGKLKPAEMQGGVFTVSSLGAIGGTGFTPIVNTPEVGILGVSKSDMKPVWNGSEFIPRYMLPLALSYDHRVINGGDAGRFLTHVVATLSDIRRLAM